MSENKRSVYVKDNYNEGLEELKTVVKSALENEIKLITIGLKKTMGGIRNYEDKFEMDSETFYKKYSSGEAGDDIEYIRLGLIDGEELKKNIYADRLVITRPEVKL